MFGRKNQPNSGTYFGPDGQMATVSGNTAFVSGAGSNSGVYTQCGNTIIGPNGVSTISGTGSTQTIFGPNGISTVFNNGSTSTVMGPDGTMHTVFHNPSGGGTVF